MDLPVIASDEGNAFIVYGSVVGELPNGSSVEYTQSTLPFEAPKAYSPRDVEMYNFPLAAIGWTLSGINGSIGWYHSTLRLPLTSSGVQLVLWGLAATIGQSFKFIATMGR